MPALLACAIGPLNTEAMGSSLPHTHTLHTFVYVELWRASDCTAVQPADEVCC